ncbi:MAG: hypothetical protein KC729_11205, partial [Candidatus Eisenbacteria bacterium]|nr:hypothetical protein [Candidatus Eisenbacteria bacterium]
ADRDFSHRMDANELDLRVTNLGSFAYDPEHGGDLHFPAGSDKTALFAGGFFLAGHVGGELRVSAAEYAFSFAPGPLVGGEAPADDPRFRVYRLDEQSGPGSADFDSWPVSDGAPTDASNRPLLLGSQTLWSVCGDASSDRKDIRLVSDEPLHVTVRQTTWAYRYPGALGRTVFFRYDLTNDGPSILEDVWFSMWSDPDIGTAAGVRAGSAPDLDLGYAYKEAGFDDPMYGGAAPAVGFVLLETPNIDNPEDPDLPVELGMTAFMSYVNGADPAGPDSAWAFMRGLDAEGQPVVDPTNQEPTPFWYAGDPLTGTGWLDEIGANRKMFTSTGPFMLFPGRPQTVVVALVLGQGADHLDSVRDLFAEVEEIRQRFQDDRFPQLVQVHPGDLDRNGVVNAADVEPLVVSWGERGPARASASLEFSAQPVLAWPATEATFADGNGDGIVDMADLLTIGLNWGRTYTPVGTSIVAEIDPVAHREALRAILDALDGMDGESAEAMRAQLGAFENGAPSVPGLTIVGIGPIPFRDEGRVAFRLSEPAMVAVRVLDATGRVVCQREPILLTTGLHREVWNGRDREGRPLGSGVYWLRLETERGAASARLVHVR